MIFQKMAVPSNCALLHSGNLEKYSCAESTTSACRITGKMWPRLQVEKFHDMAKFGALFSICIKLNLVKLTIAQLVKKFPFIKLEDSLLCSKTPTRGPYL
jgi:hypothetical protein